MKLKGQKCASPRMYSEVVMRTAQKLSSPAAPSNFFVIAITMVVTKSLGEVSPLHVFTSHIPPQPCPPKKHHQEKPDTFFCKTSPIGSQMTIDKDTRLEHPLQFFFFFLMLKKV